MSNAPIKVAEPVLDGREAEYVLKCIEETWISSRGEFVDRFESMIADLCGVKHAVVTNNGTTALHLALVACGIESGDEVIMPSLTYVATANATAYCNAKPVFVDSEPQYLNIDPKQIEAAITDKSRAIITVPLYGHPVDMDAVQEIADRHNLVVIEDSAEALGASYRGRPVGSLAKCSTFSFFGNKLVTTGEGGAIATDDEELAARRKFCGGQAVDPNRAYWHDEIGFNYRMTNIAAAIGVAQLERIDDLLERRQRVAAWYNERLGEHRDLLQLPEVAEWAKHSYWMYTVLLQPDLGVDRDTWMQMLAGKGIETRPVFYPVHWMRPYRQFGSNFKVAESCSSRGINLPTHGNLTEANVDYVCKQVVATVERLRTNSATPDRKAA